ncbi:hypothetical protein ACG98H_04455 [Corynebacterium sp. L4756]|uniref:hypothetical protein n=1 Tax=unclassified Corynebacterium TaxID=2624378 RepID=UPI00374D42FC
MPTETVLDGYTITQQHVIDHEFLLLGSPFSLSTPVFLICFILGLAALIFAAFKRSALFAILSIFLIGAKYLWLPFYLWFSYEDARLFGYAWKIYPGYWVTETILIAALVVIALAVIAHSLITRKRARELR